MALTIPRLRSLRIQGYRPFRDFTAELGDLTVLVGANGAGKSSILEFLRFLRDSVHQEIPPEVVPRSGGQQIFHSPGPDRFWWSLEFDLGQPYPLRYQGELMGPVGRTQVSFERVVTAPPKGTKSYLFLNVRNGEGLIQDPESKRLEKQSIALRRPNQLALSTINNPSLVTLYNLREAIQSWRFYSAFNIDHSKIRKTVPVEQEPVLHEDAGNLSSVLHFLMTEHPDTFQELHTHLQSVVPGFRRLTVKARGGPGEVIAFWSEAGVDADLTLADLSDGTIRLVCWIVLAIQPNPPALVGIDEPDQGVHPRTLPVLAGLFDKATSRCQFLLATHASYFLTQFDLESIAVMRREDGAAVLTRPASSDILRQQLEEFGSDELEVLHRSDELAALA